MLQLILITYFIVGMLIATIAALVAHNDAWGQYTVTVFCSIVIVWLPLLMLAVFEINYDHNY